MAESVFVNKFSLDLKYHIFTSFQSARSKTRLCKANETRSIIKSDCYVTRAVKASAPEEGILLDNGPPKPFSFPLIISENGRANLILGDCAGRALDYY